LGALDYSRHFLVLTSVAALVVLTDRWRPSLGAPSAFGVYGALHSSVIGATLRAPREYFRKLLFIVLAAALSAFVAVTALAVNRLLGSTFGINAPSLILTLASGLGAVAYGSLIRRFWIPAMPPRALLGIALCCMLATLAGVPLGLYLHTISGWWFAMLWWFAFSAALWSVDVRR